MSTTNHSLAGCSLLATQKRFNKDKQDNSLSAYRFQIWPLAADRDSRFAKLLVDILKSDAFEIYPFYNQKMRFYVAIFQYHRDCESLAFTLINKLIGKQ